MQLAENCRTSVMVHFTEYHEACASSDWKRADHIRMVLAEAIEASLDATAAVFRALENNPDGKAKDLL